MGLLYMDSPIGNLMIEDNGMALTKVNVVKNVLSDAVIPTEITCLAKIQLEEYFAGKRTGFSIPLLLSGTDFQKRVWNALAQIPFGETRTYGEIAAQTGNQKSCRAVGMACNKNNILIIIPCHRVIGADRKLTGFGAGLEVKEWLIRHESIDMPFDDGGIGCIN